MMLRKKKEGKERKEKKRKEKSPFFIDDLFWLIVSFLPICDTIDLVKTCNFLYRMYGNFKSLYNLPSIWPPGYKSNLIHLWLKQKKITYKELYIFYHNGTEISDLFILY